MDLDRKRYGRQLRLAEVGEDGQRKLCAATCVLASSGFARIVEERYLRGAGVTPAALDGEEAAPEVPELGLRHRAAAEVADGALAALVSMRAVLQR
jgi:hypothetical protein